MLPAYAKPLLERRRRGLAPVGDLWIVCDWATARARSWRVVIDPRIDPLALDWRIAAGLSCLLVGSHQERLDAAAVAIASAGPSALVGLCRLPRPHAIVYVPAQGGL